MIFNNTSHVSKQIKLSICLLTYNREKHLNRILNFLKDEYKSLEFKESVEIIISDNHSTDNTESIIRKFLDLNKLNYWIYKRNTENIGLLGNLLNGEKLANGEYLWWMGDDDYYKPGIINSILKHIKQDPDYIFLNYSYSKYKPWDGEIVKSVVDLVDSKNFKIEYLIKKHPGYIMFISSSIYKMELLKQLKNKKYKQNLALPLLYSLYCASKGNYIVDNKVWVDDNIKEISWSNKASQVFYFDVPYYISLMPQLGYNSKESKEIYDYLYKGIWKSRLKYQIIKILKKIYLLDVVRRIKHIQ